MQKKKNQLKTKKIMLVLLYPILQNNFNLETSSWKKQKLILVDLSSQTKQEEVLVNIHIMFAYK